MGTVPSPHRFPGWREGPWHKSTGFLITTAAAQRLSSIATNHLRLIVRSSYKELSHFSHVTAVTDVWHERAHLFSGYGFLESSCSAVSARCSSYLYFISKEESINEGKSSAVTPNRKPFNGRLWTNVLIAANILVFAAQIASQGKLLLLGAKINSLIDKGELWRMATSSFVHANVGHLLVNCYSLNSIGPVTETISGPRRFLTIYCSSAIASSAMSYWFCQAPSVGASGAIFGLVGSYAVFILRHKNLFGGAKQDLQHITKVISLNMVVGILSKGIDNWGHLGGLLGGAVTAWFLGPSWKYEHRTDEGVVVYADRAPVSYLRKKK